MKDQSPEAVARRAADAQRKRDERARKKEVQAAAASQEELNAAKSFPEYWAAQRVNLTEAQRAGFEQREDYVLDLQHIMRLYLEGQYEAEATRLGVTAEGYVSLDDLKAAVAEEIAAHSVCEAVVLVVPKLWPSGEKDLREAIMAKGGATALLLQYGYRTALDGFLYERFYQKFLMPRTESQQTFTTITCLCGATSSISVEVASLYTARIFRCLRCLDKEATSKAAVAKALAAEYRVPENTLYDDWGRLKL